ncbi:hypothetical protein Q1W70_26880 [Pseudomonas kielensis]|jgi:hypothetical protein|uniref:hypothetical protein n=1 Tax=Pseudomonas kielensis TaxID=2762577 RepID=UPI00223FE819|nr:hypothetical protein [Pseudomonas kielensis]UZM14927.1 hypothetical protein LZV00_03825 [Pseudomonas kielensis]WKL52984.1 hypothetical protein Q1W70_26880 [Pseudomonas kielensis]
MTAEEFWKSWLAFGLLAGPGLLGFLSIAYSQYLRRRHLQAMKEAMKNSRYICIWGTNLGKRGWIWSLLEMAKISQMITMPRSSLQVGELDPDDLENFPTHLKRLLKINSVILVGGATWFVIVVVLLKFK